MHRGVTLVELLVVVTIVGTLMLLALPQAGKLTDRLLTARATDEVAMFYHRARYAALMRATPVRVDFAADTLKATYQGVRDSVFLVLGGPAKYGVQLTASRSSIRIRPTGWGWGAANTKLVFRRGAAAESLTTSRLGRLKRWR